MSNVKVRGIVIKKSDFGEANRVLTIFTKEYGIIRAAVYGAKSIKSKNSAGSQFLTYADFILRDNGRDFMTLQSCDVIESFFPIQEDIVKLSLCVYFSDLIYNLINQNVPDEDILRLFLNTVYALCYKELENETVRAVFELRVLSYAGYRPNLNNCTLCHSCDDITAFSPKMGGIVCRQCRKREDISINGDIYHAIKYILTAEEKKMLTFQAASDVMSEVSKIAESYMRAYTDKEFASLEYYKKINI